jgi:MFS family permease
LISTFDFGASFIFDLPQSLAIAFEEQLNLDDSKCLLFYSAYSFPNLFVNLIGGWILGKIGYKRALLLYASIVCVGHSLFVLGAFRSAYWLMMAGRAIQGVGAENLMISQYFTSHTFFKNNLLSFAVGADMTIGLGASVIAFYLMPWLYLNKTTLRDTLLYSLIAPLLSLLSVVVFICIYRTQKKIDSTVKLINSDLREECNGINNPSDRYSAEPESECPSTDGITSPGSDTREDNGIMDTNRQEPNPDIPSQPTRHKQPFKLSNLKDFPATFWCLAGLAFICLTTYYQFIGVATKLISIKYDLDYDQAKNVPPIVPLITIPLIPLLTRGVYTFGHKPLMMTIGCIIGIASFLTMMLGKQLSPYFVCAMVSLFSSCIYSGFWSSAAIASEAVHVDMGLAIINTIQNLGSFIMPIIFSTFIQTIDKSNADSFLLLLIGLLSVSLLFSISLLILDRKSGGRIAAAENNRQQIH